MMKKISAVLAGATFNRWRPRLAALSDAVATQLGKQGIAASEIRVSHHSK